MEFGLHLPQLDLGLAPPVDAARLAAAVDAAVEHGFVALSANDHFTFSRGWTDGLVMLAAAAPRARDLDVMTTVALPTLRGPVPYAAAMSALAAVCEGRVIAGVGPGSSGADHALLGVLWEERWSRFDDAAKVLRALFDGRPAPGSAWYPVPESPTSVSAGRVELWLAGWGSPAGLRRAVRHGDGWLASAYHASPQSFGVAWATVQDELRRAGRDPDEFGHALVTMWTWITDDREEAARMLEVLAACLGTAPGPLAGRVCVGSPEHCARLLTAYAEQGCRRVHVWPLTDEAAQVERLVRDVLPHVRG